MGHDLSEAATHSPLKGIICYYSGSGNTRLACQHIQNKIKSVQFDLFNIAKGGVPDLGGYDTTGFACFTDFLDPPYLFKTFFEKLMGQDVKPAFVFNTYGFINGKTQQTLAKWASARGFKVIAGHSLHTPESYPPMIAGGRGNERAPNEKELSAFKRFVTELDESYGRLAKGGQVEKMKDRFSIYDLLPQFSRTRSRRNMGIKFVDVELCKECHTCEKLCPYGAIKLDPKPIFDMDKCYGCWSCYNHCANKAIYTRKFREVGQYPRPIDALKEKLEV